MSRYSKPGIKKKLARICRMKGMAVYELEDKMGVCRGFFCKEGGMLVENLVRACDVLGVSISEVTK